MFVACKHVLLHCVCDAGEIALICQRSLFMLYASERLAEIALNAKDVLWMWLIVEYHSCVEQTFAAPFDNALNKVANYVFVGCLTYLAFAYR